MNRQRPQKVASALKREIAQACLLESENPLLKELAITRVEVSSDLRVARVYYSNCINPSTDRAMMARQLARASAYLRRFARTRISMKHFPELRFIYDTDAEKLGRIEDILRQIKSQEQE